jgi:hypothetical protein
MTKKHLKLFADEIKYNLPVGRAQEMMAEIVISVSKKVNPKFDEKKFLKACELLS